MVVKCCGYGVDSSVDSTDYVALGVMCGSAVGSGVSVYSEGAGGV